MESSGAVASIRETRIANAAPERRKLITPRLGEIELASHARAPRTREEIARFQLLAVEIVASRLSEGLPAPDAREIKDAVESAKEARGTWPKAEFLFRMRDAGLFFRALELFREVESFSAVA